MLAQTHPNPRLSAAARRGLVMLVTTAALLCAPVPSAVAQSQASSSEVQLFRIGTGGPQGTYFPVGNLIANALSESTAACPPETRCGVPGLLSVAQLSNGSVANVEAISAGVLEAGLVQADVAHWAYSGTGIFEGKRTHTGLRAVASLYQENVHVVVARDSGIRSIGDLKDRRVSLDEPGSGTLVDARIVLEAAGLSEATIRPVYIKPQFAAEKLAQNSLDAFFIVAGSPTKSVLDLATRGKVMLVPIGLETAEAIQQRYPFLAPSTIAAQTYPGIPETHTVSVAAQLLVSASLSNDLVYQITRELWTGRTRNMLVNGHPKGKEIRLKSAAEGIGIPLHPGAMRYYLEHRISLPGG
jgi:TRAP transporter TAXI family solute receptor